MIKGRRLFAVIGALCALGVCVPVQALADERCLNMGASHRHEAAADVRKLTLSIGQPAASVSGDPALADIVAAVPFEKGVAVYVNQPFDLTYEQEGLSFNVPKTHTLWMSASDKKLTVIGIELCPLFENDFDGAIRTLQQWKMLFDGMVLEKIDNHPGFKVSDIASLGERFRSVSLPRFGQAVGLWRTGNTYLSLELARIGRKYIDEEKGAVEREVYVYKVSLGLSDAERFESIYSEAKTR